MPRATTNRIRARSERNRSARSTSSRLRCRPSERRRAAPTSGDAVQTWMALSGSRPSTSAELIEERAEIVGERGKERCSRAAEQVEMVSGEDSQPERRRCLLAPTLELLLAHLVVCGAAEGRD